MAVTAGTSGFRDRLISVYDDVGLPAMLPDASEDELLTLLPHRWKPA
jgi:hypothetical protein